MDSCCGLARVLHSRQGWVLESYDRQEGEIPVRSEIWNRVRQSRLGNVQTRRGDLTFLSCMPNFKETRSKPLSFYWMRLG